MGENSPRLVKQLTRIERTALVSAYREVQLAQQALEGARALANEILRDLGCDPAKTYRLNGDTLEEDDGSLARGPDSPA